MIQVIAVRMSGGQQLQHIATLRWVNVSQPGGPPSGDAKESSRSDMVNFVRQNPRQVFAMSTRDNTYAFLEVVEAQPPYVKTMPDSTRTDNLLSLPRF